MIKLPAEETICSHQYERFDKEERQSRCFKSYLEEIAGSNDIVLSVYFNVSTEIHPNKWEQQIESIPFDEKPPSEPPT